MSTSFNFPPDPTLNQVVVLPDGNSAQWNGYAWVSVGDNVTYPLPVPKGGTGATNPFTAKRNLDIPIWTLDDAAPAAPVFGDRWIRPGSMTEVVWLPNSNPAGGGVWVNLADVGTAAYPIPINKGGTGATTPAAARLNLGLDNAAGQRILGDGTAAAPGLAWNSEPGLGFWRRAASTLMLAGQGQNVFNMDFSVAAVTYLGINSRAASGNAQIDLINGQFAAPNTNSLLISQDSSGAARIVTTAAGTATRGNLTLDAPQVLFPNGAVAKPNIAFAGEPGLGFYREGPGIIRVAQGGRSPTAFYSDAHESTIEVDAATGNATLLLANVLSPGNYNSLLVRQGSDGNSYLLTQAAGTATRGALNLDAPQINFANSGGPGSGWQKLNNGLIIQWGSVAGSGNVPFNYPIAFPNACISIVLTPDVSAAAAAATAWAYSVGGVNRVGATAVKRYIGGTAGPDFAGEGARYVAIGY